MIQHRLSAVDPISMTAICKVCGPVKIVKRGMQVSSGKQRYGCAFLWTAKRFRLRYGIDNIEEIIKVSGGGCVICGITENLCIDHDHITSKIRGVLCKNCNLGLGFFKDDTLLLERAINYLSP